MTITNAGQCICKKEMPHFAHKETFDFIKFKKKEKLFYVYGQSNIIFAGNRKEFFKHFKVKK